ncbi:MAG: protein AtpC [Candidatus Magasanikbacteria bacterium GW2011_GWA2_40_10]|uniref:ATP synthase epsilon chain n=1 Tax=Candidatus Magasanikbacteria bacterium GW2011_GWA2_40_10 TaxID=1619037 RepID=A0A0G0QBB9_9BACT|nr:MAG: protein AtpC [Candidatus Magasanikbacteria bacterium GW2011_GWA2_40_10]
MSTLKFKIVTPEKVIYENEISQVSIPTMNGEITILPNHIPLVSVLKAGELKIKDKDGEHNMAVSGGFLEVRGNNEIVILADHAERVADIDLQKAEEARQRAEEQMKQIQNVQDVDYARLQAVIDRETNKMRVAKKYRNLPNQ